MDRTFLTRLEIYSFNLKRAKDLKKKEKILNHLNDLLIPLRDAQFLINYMFLLDKCFLHFLMEHNLSHMILLLYDLREIARVINLPDNHIIIYDDKKFKIIEHEIIEENINDDVDESILNMSMSKTISWADD